MASITAQYERWLQATGRKHSDLVYRLGKAVAEVEYNTTHVETLTDEVIRHAKDQVKDFSHRLNHLNGRRIRQFRMVGGVII